VEIKRIGLDLAKNVFEVHGVDEIERVVLRKTLGRGKVLEFFARLPACVVGMEACGGAHHWARKLIELGHDARLMAPQFVAPYRKGHKSDRNDAEAICEAAGRGSMRFVPVKDEEQQAVQMLHRMRALQIAERTALANQTRGLLAEFGIVVAQGLGRLRARLPEILEETENGLPALARELFADLRERLVALDAKIGGYDRRIEQLARASEVAQRLMRLEGIGAVTATAGDARRFANGRQFAAWMGLVPREYSSGGKIRRGRIGKRGDAYLRTLLIHGARVVYRHLGEREDKKSRWLRQLAARRGVNKAVVALAAKHARILWALLSRGSDYQPMAA